MREIKFRVSTIDRMFYVVNGGEYQLTFGMGPDWSLWDEEGEICNSNEAVTELMQYTGLKDNNGKEIYEGDICTIWMGTKQDNPYVVEDLRELYLDLNHADSYYRITNIKVIGNIYENPELVQK